MIDSYLNNRNILFGNDKSEDENKFSEESK